MTDTVLSSATKEVVIGFERPFCIIGERINPTGRKLLAAEMAAGDYSRVKSDAIAQVACGQSGENVERHARTDARDGDQRREQGALIRAHEAEQLLDIGIL